MSDKHDEAREVFIELTRKYLLKEVKALIAERGLSDTIERLRKGDKYAYSRQILSDIDSMSRASLMGAAKFLGICNFITTMDKSRRNVSQFMEYLPRLGDQIDIADFIKFVISRLRRNSVESITFRDHAGNHVKLPIASYSAALRRTTRPLYFVEYNYHPNPGALTYEPLQNTPPR